MRTIVLMAGEGQRFKDAGCTVPKPLIVTNSGKSILELSVESILPFGAPITLAVRTEHMPEAQTLIHEVYGSHAKLVEFDKLTRGNLETAVIACKQDYSPDKSLLVLDSDNIYDSRRFWPLVDSIPEKDHAVICYFEPRDDSEKWCFAELYTNRQRGIDRVIDISEKKAIPKGKPMMGVFYYSSQRLFLEIAEKILDAGEKSNNEFYMSQTIQKLLFQGVAVYGFKSDTVTALGTPEDLRKYNDGITF